MKRPEEIKFETDYGTYDTIILTPKEVTGLRETFIEFSYDGPAGRIEFGGPLSTGEAIMKLITREAIASKIPLDETLDAT